jgi:protein-S-isoprenylcysteine O-methyltransferase Ste14
MAAPIVIRTLSLLVPVVLTWGLLLHRRPSSRIAAAAFLAFAWVFTSSLAVNLAALRLGWWSFEALGGIFAGIPVDLWLGWALLWGAAPILAFGTTPLWLLSIGVVWADLVLMPASAPVVHLKTGWLWGEAFSVVACLLPALLLARWTRDNSHLAARASLQVILFASLALWVVPLVILTQTGGHIEPVLRRPSWVLSMAGQLLAGPAILGGSAVLEFCQRGRGTPFPWDPPTRLVTTGPYAYVANPMQLSMTLLMMGLGTFLASVPVALAGVVAGIFGSGFARWQEQGDLTERFGDRWHAYRVSVRSWLPRWRPCDYPTATLYYAASCIECSAVGTWFLRRSPVALLLLPAEGYPGPCPTRITYVAHDGQVFSGVAALARALDHLNLAWAWLGWTARLPGICHLVQVVIDALGGGPKLIAASGA